MDLSPVANQSSMLSSSKSIHTKDNEVKEHHNTIWSSLNSQRFSGEYCDVALHCKDEVYYAHKYVLSTVSPYFRTSFTTLLRPSPFLHVINFDDFSSNSVRLLLDYIYQEVPVSHSDALELLELASFILYDSLVAHLVEAVRPMIEVSNVLDIFEVAHNCGCEGLVFLTECFIRENIGKLHWAAMKESIDIKTILHHAWNAKVQCNNKEVAHVTVCGDDDEYIFDPEKMSLEPYRNDYKSPYFGPPFCSYPYDPCFVWNNMVFIVTEGGICYEQNRVQLQKYQHCSRNFECVKEYIYGDFNERMALKRFDWSLQRAVYDGEGNVYLGVEESFESSDFYLNKIDLCTLLLYDGYIHMESLNTPFDTSLLLLKEGLCYVRIEFMMKLNDFNFDQSESHIADKIPLKFDHLLPNPDDYHFEFDSCGKSAYCALKPKDLEDNTHIIIKLDASKRSWVHVHNLEVYDIERMISCNGKVFLVITDGEEDDWMIAHLNTDTKTIENTGLNLSVGGSKHYDYSIFFNFPAYLYS